MTTTSRIINLDEAGIFAAPLNVRLKGRDYLLPADLPAPLYVEIQLLSAMTGPDIDAEAANEATLRVYGKILALFREHQPDLEDIPLGISEMVEVVGIVYADAVEADDGAPADPPAAATEKTPTPRRRAAPKRSAAKKTSQAKSSKSPSST